MGDGLVLDDMACRSHTTGLRYHMAAALSSPLLNVVKDRLVLLNSQQEVNRQACRPRHRRPTRREALTIIIFDGRRVRTKSADDNIGLQSGLKIQ